MFTPDNKKQDAKAVPFFEDTTSSGGWKGHTTQKAIKVLQAQIKATLERMDGTVDQFISGTFEVNGQTRYGFQMLYVLPGPDGKQLRARIDIAALPVRDKNNLRKREQALRMALYMVSMALEGAWFLEVLSPGFSVLMPGILDDKGRTLSDLYSTGMTDHLLPSGESFQEDIINGEVKDV